MTCGMAHCSSDAPHMRVYDGCDQLCGQASAVSMSATTSAAGLHVACCCGRHQTCVPTRTCTRDARPPGSRRAVQFTRSFKPINVCASTSQSCGHRAGSGCECYSSMLSTGSSDGATLGAVNICAAKACVALIIAWFCGLAKLHLASAIRTACSKSSRSCLTPCAGANLLSSLVHVAQTNQARKCNLSQVEHLAACRRMTAAACRAMLTT